MKQLLFSLLAFAVFVASAPECPAQPPGEIKLDFSTCGYASGNEPIPDDVPPIAVVDPAEGDSTSAIQAALDHVAGLPVGENGFRGAVRLAPGEFRVEGQLVISVSGVVLQGSGAGQGGTVLVATGTDRRSLIRIAGKNDFQFAEGTSPMQVVDENVPVGANSVTLVSTAGFEVGDQVLVTRPSTEEWLARLDAKQFGVTWKVGTRDIHWERNVTAVSGNKLSFDAPITTALEKSLGGATVQPYIWPGRIDHVGVQDLRCISQVESENPLDEDHAWHGVVLENAEDAWVRRMRFEHFAGGAVLVTTGARRVTVADCISQAPVSELGGYRRQTYFTQGGQSLFLRCWAEEGIHDFAVGHCAPGPNAFVNCFAKNAHGDSGPLESWASGVLYDNVRIDGGALTLANRWSTPPGAGWSAANCVLWQCRAGQINCFAPPGAENYAIGCWANFAGDGKFEARSDFVRPLSLFQGQLGERVGRADAERIGPFLGQPQSATNPTYEEAERFVARSHEPATQLIDLIERNQTRATAKYSNEVDWQSAKAFTPPATKPATKSQHLFSVDNGWLVTGGRVKTGGRMGATWWRGNIRPDEAPSFGPGIMRFVPGRVGTGLTDDLNEVAAGMLRRGVANYEHHYGLWYERRRDDHLMVRRDTGEVAPPFYEQPFARTGQGAAWDGLSKYDLTKFNPWYWNRLRDFAELCTENGLVLTHQHYFQHNILEAGAHWVDCPWRPANNVNHMNLPEPPPFIGDKRLFMAPNFYDLNDPERRALHRNFIRQCLNATADRANVIHMISDEFTGPLEFVQFWFDTIGQWQTETGHDALIALSTTKDVQDAILADLERSKLVDIVDIRYWTYDRDMNVYAPPGGANLAPRQHMRQMKPEPSSFASIVHAVQEYRLRYPQLAVMYNADQACRSGRDGWAVLIGGGSLADVRLPEELGEVLPSMEPAEEIIESDSAWCLADIGKNYLVYSDNPRGTLNLKISAGGKPWQASWIDSRSGRVVGTETIDDPAEIRLKSAVLWLRK